LAAKFEGYKTTTDRTPIKLKHYEVSKGYLWIFLGLLSGFGFGLPPVILGKTSFYGVVIRSMMGTGSLAFTIALISI